MLCRVCCLREGQCRCQHVNRGLPPDSRYTTLNNVFRPQNYSNSTNEAYISNTPDHPQSADANLTRSQSTHQLQEPGIPYPSGYAPSNHLSGTSTGQTYDSPSLSFDPRALTNNSHSQVSSVEWTGQSHSGDEAIKQRTAKPRELIGPEVAWASFKNPHANYSFHTTYPSTNFTSMNTLQPYSPIEYDTSGYSNNLEHYPSQQNNLVASGNEEIQAALDGNSRINQAGITLRGPEPSGTSEAYYPFVNITQPQFSTSYPYSHSQIQEPSTTIATDPEPAPLDNQNQHSPSGAISDPCKLPRQCPHEKCRRNSTRVFAKSSDLQAHWYRAHEKRFPCSICNAIFGTFAEVKRHLTAIHVDGPKEFTCQVSGCASRSKEFNRKHRLKEHKEKWHGDYYCSAMYCPRGLGHGFKDQILLNDHLIKSHGPGKLR